MNEETEARLFRVLPVYPRLDQIAILLIVELRWKAELAHNDVGDALVISLEQVRDQILLRAASLLEAHLGICVVLLDEI